MDFAHADVWRHDTDQPDSPPSPAKQATQSCIDSPSTESLCDVAAAAASSGYPDVLDALSDTLMDSLTDDWRKLRNALWLVEHLLNCTPQLWDDLCAEPGMLRGLLGFWAEDEYGHDCGEEVRMRASSLLGRLEAHEEALRAARAELQPWSAVEQHSKLKPCYSDAEDSPTNSEDSTASAFSPFAATRENAASHKPSGGSFSLPSFKLPKLRVKAAAPVAVPAPAANLVAGGSGKPPLARRSFGASLGASLGASRSFRRNTGSRELVVAWGQIRGQDSSDFARMLQLLDDKCFDKAQEAYEQLQRRRCG